MTRVGRMPRADVLAAYYHAQRDAWGRWDASVVRLLQRHGAWFPEWLAADSRRPAGRADRLYRELVLDFTGACPAPLDLP